MSIFNEFPYTNFHDMNLDWLLKRVKETDSKVDNFILTTDDKIIEQVNKWLTDHPEATTTVQNYSLDNKKMVRGTLGYIMPEMLGAVADGVTDDASYIQQAIDFAAAHKIPVYLSGKYFVNATLNVPERVKIVGAFHDYTTPKVLAGPSVSTLFNCAGPCDTFEGFSIYNYEDVYRNFDAIVLDGDSNHNIDAHVINMCIAYADRGIVVKGRNAAIDGCEFSHCRVGVDFDLPAGNYQWRGLHVENCDFHGNGEEAGLGWFENSACIKAAANYMCNVIIRNCTAEQSGTFFQGYANQLLIENNFLECFKKTPISIVTPDLTNPGNTGSILIQGNMIRGKAGEVATGVSVPMPDHMIEVYSYGRVNIANNNLGPSYMENVKLGQVFKTFVQGNAFVGPGADGVADHNAALLTAGGTVFVQNNIAMSNGTNISRATETTTLIPNGNTGFTLFDQTNTNYSRPVNYYKIRDLVPGTSYASTILTPGEYVVRRPNNKDCFQFTVFNNRYISSSICQADDGNGYMILYWITTDTTITPKLAYIPNDGSSVEQYTSTVGLFHKIDL